VIVPSTSAGLATALQPVTHGFLQIRVANTKKFVSQIIFTKVVKVAKANLLTSKDFALKFCHISGCCLFKHFWKTFFV